MELSKEQIQYIEHRLENEGVKYWDIRIELLDHVVSDLEKNLKENSSEANFKKMVQNSFIFLGWNGSFDDLTKQRLFGINKIVRKQYFNQIGLFFTNFKSIFLIFLITSFYYFVLVTFNLKTFKVITMFILFAPMIYGGFLYFSEFSKKRKSGYLTYSTFYIFFSFLMLNGVIQFVKPDGIIPVAKETQLLVWFAVTCLNTLFSSAGILVHHKTLKKIKNIELKLKSI
ncbi:hypothetical protein [Polaribacter sp. M15]